MRAVYPWLMFGLFLACVYSAYRTSYDARAAASHLERLTEEIQEEERQTVILSAEWSYLNRGDRLAALAGQFHDRLLLEPLLPAQIAPAPAEYRPDPYGLQSEPKP